MGTGAVGFNTVAGRAALLAPLTRTDGDELIGVDDPEGDSTVGRTGVKAGDNNLPLGPTVVQALLLCVRPGVIGTLYHENQIMKAKKNCLHTLAVESA